ncbi:glutathione S-transferase [Xylariales sp. PMI_506]|nr:glutathione S-transferase [Xylariales sp. PMI_506]
MTSRGAKITLYWLERSRAQRVMWLMEELSIPYDIKTFKRNPNGTAPPELKKIHPLGKSPVISIETPDSPKPMVLAESGVILEYLVDHFGAGSTLVPKRYRDGLEGQIGGETEAWMRYQYYMQYAEGSFMPPILIQLLMNALRARQDPLQLIVWATPRVAIKQAPVPFFVRPLTGLVAGKVSSEFLAKELETHFKFFEDQLASAPGGGPYLCGDILTTADIQMILPLQAAASLSIIGADDKYPKVVEYVKRLERSDAYMAAVRKVEELEGKPFVAV